MKKTSSLVSIITVTLNNLTGLRQTIKSVLTQDWPAIELIVVDGGSKDGSLEFLENTEGITRWISEKDKGIYDAQNKGLAMAKGHFVIFLNAGDWFYQLYVVSLLMKRVQKGRELIFGNILLQDSKKNLVKREYPWPLPPHFFDYDTLPQCVTLIPAKLIRRRGGLNINLKICADFQFFRAVVLARQVVILHEPNALAVFDTGGLSGLPQSHSIIEKEKQNIKQLEHTFKAKWLGKLDRLTAKWNIWLPRW